VSRAATSFPWLRLHSRLAATRYWQDRLTVCGLGALLLSFVAWLLGAHLLWHLGFIALGSALGFLPRLRSGQGWALHWLDTHLGLSYRTALEVPRGDDHYGLYTALHRRVERAGKNLERPSPQPWWLPLFAVAFGLLLVPNAPWSAASPLSTAPGMSGPEVPPAAAEDPDEASAEEPPGDEPESPEGADAPAGDPGDPDGPEGEGSGAPGQGGRAPEGGAGSERQALEDFLRSVEEAEEDEGGSEGAPSGAPDESGEEEGREGPTQAREADREDDGREPGDSGEPGEPGEPGAEPGEGDEAQAAEAAEGEQSAPQTQPAGAEEGEEGDDGAEQGQGEEEGLEDGGEEGLGEGPSDEGAEAQGQPGGEDAPGPEGDAEGGDLDPGGGVGADGLAPDAEGLFETLEREEDRPEFVPGQRDDGGRASSGVVRLPGGGQAEGPAGAAPESFERGLERAITEGRIPVEYHEVLRDYFR
jgi:hypothetical protein